MKPERWHQIEAIFQEALDHKPENRNAFVADRCGGDTSLENEVEKLLKNSEAADSFIENPVWMDSSENGESGGPFAETFVDLFSDHEPAAMIGKRVGVFKLTKELGKGGMGTVFLAERADGEFRQKVAVKLIRRGMNTDFIIRRFRHERQILASFDHPFISRLIDGGRTPDGLPYFVMEFVEGDSLYDYSDRKSLDLRSRLKLFRQICSAVSYAHERQIIHRDIKPGNILVTGDGVPKLLDFGIAKILDSDLIHESESPTSSFMRLMTPDYASPEQIAGKEIGTASDIYSLGVLLYELLTGHNPHNFKELPIHEISRIVSEDAPKLPSRVVVSGANLLTKYGSDPENFAKACNSTTRDLVLSLRGDLDNIIMKALAKDPASRYQTVEEMSFDLQRFMRNEPVFAKDFVRQKAGLFFSGENGPSAGNTLAVLPFKYQNLGAARGPNEDFLGAGLADALITRFSKLRRFTVRPTSSFLAQDGSDIDPIEAGLALDVEYVLEGTIKRVDERLRVTVQLLDVAENSAIWATSIDETISDIFTLEDNIATRIVEGLLPRITGIELKDYSQRGTENPEAFEHCLRGRYFFNSGTEEGLAKAFVCFHQAIAADPDYSNAYVGIADYYDFLGIYGVLPPKECFNAAIEAATKAVELDENSEMAHASLGFAVHAGNYDWSKAEYHLGRALELNPNYAVAYAWFAIVRYTQGRFAEGLEFAERAIELDPLTPFNHHNVGWGLIFARRYEESINQYGRVVAHFPNYGLGYYGLSRALRYSGNTDEALLQIEKAKKFFGDSVFVKTSEAECHAAAGNIDGAMKYLEELKALSKKRYVSPYQFAMLYSYLEDRESVLLCLEEALEMKEAWLNWMGVEPVFDIVRDDPRFQEILEATGYQFFFNDLSLHDSRTTGLIDSARRDTSETMLLEHRPGTSVGKSGRAAGLLKRVRTLQVLAAAALLIFSGFGAYFFFGPGSAAPGVPALSQVLNPNSIVILPFTGEGASDENLGVGLADALSGRLGYIKRLSVISPNSGRIIAREIAGKPTGGIPARFVLRGSISRQDDKRVAVNVELADITEGKTLWNETFASENEEFISIQNKIAEKIWTTLNVEPMPSERLFVSKPVTKNKYAYELYLIGRSLMITRSPESLRKAIASFTQAAQEDPEFALAYAGLSDAYILLSLYEMPAPPDAFQKAKLNARRALELDENLAEAHTSLAYITFYVGKDRQGAELGFRRAIQINPSYSQAHHWFAIVLMAMNRPMDSVEEMKTAEQLDPRSLIVRTALGMMYVYNRQYEEALKECNEVLATDSGFVPALKVKRWIYQAKGNYAAARDAFRKERSYSGGEARHPGWYVIEAQVEAMIRNKKEVAAELDRVVASKEVSGFPSTYSYEIALAYNALGENRKALAWLEKGSAAGDNSINMLGVDPRFENIRNDPAFRIIQNRVSENPVLK